MRPAAAVFAAALALAGCASLRPSNPNGLEILNEGIAQSGIRLVQVEVEVPQGSNLLVGPLRTSVEQGLRDRGYAITNAMGYSLHDGTARVRITKPLPARSPQGALTHETSIEVSIHPLRGQMAVWSARIPVPMGETIAARTLTDVAEALAHLAPLPNAPVDPSRGASAAAGAFPIR